MRSHLFLGAHKNLSAWKPSLYRMTIVIQQKVFKIFFEKFNALLSMQ